MKKNKDFKEVIECYTEAMIIFNTKGTVKFVNLNAEKIFGYQTKELLGRGLEELIAKRFLINYKKLKESYFNFPHVNSMNNELSLFGKRKDGSEFPIKISIVPTKKGGLITATIKDVSEKLPNDHFIKKVKQLEDFAYITSHNLRSPVSNLSSLIDIYKREKTSVGKEVLFGKFEQIVEKLSETLNSLVDVLIIQNDANKTISKISFLSIYNKVIANLEYSIKDAQAEIHVDFSKASTIEYSKIYLESIIQNLLSNALKYSSFKRTPIINIKTSIINDKIQLIISDNGLGIDLKKHGSNMFKLNKTFHKNPDAKGVGLYITKAQIDTMGGKITVESKVDKGTTFTIIF